MWQCNKDAKFNFIKDFCLQTFLHLIYFKENHKKALKISTFFIWLSWFIGEKNLWKLEIYVAKLKIVTNKIDNIFCMIFLQFSQLDEKKYKPILSMKRNGTNLLKILHKRIISYLTCETIFLQQQQQKIVTENLSKKL